MKRYSAIITFLMTVTLYSPAATLYVDLNSINPVPPYASWSTAATNIQDAIDASTNGDLILVTNGVYATGGRTVNGYALTNRVVIDKAVTVQSVNGPGVTTIKGYQVPGTTNGDSAVRCVYMTNDAVLVGFTLTSGATLAAGDIHEGSGGGVWCADTTAIVSNCVLSANVADYASGVGGGAISGTFYNCTFTGNSALAGGGAYESVLNNCTLTNNLAASNGGGTRISMLEGCVLAGNSAPTGGGAEGGSLSDCTVTNNSATGNGGGVGTAILNNCVIADNSAGGDGGGTCFSSLTNCTLTDNAAANSGGASYSDAVDNCVVSNNSAFELGGGSYSSTLTNCTVLDNSAGNGGGADLGALYNCLVLDNAATSTGGGVNSTTVYNSALTGNSAVNHGGGAAGSILANCTLTGNSASSGGGVYSSVLTNCIVYYNSGTIGTNYDSGSSLAYCCTAPLPIGGSNNITADPTLADAFHLSANSPCLGAGDAAEVSGVDIDGDPWANPPAIGCDEFYANTTTGQLDVAIEATFTNLATGFAGRFRAQINGHAALCFWNFGDGTQVTNQPCISHAWTTSGDYSVSLWAFNESHPAGVNATIAVRVANQPIQYVSLANPNPVAPYLSWATAATNIQDALDATYGGGVILVSNGVYQTGGRVAAGALTNRLAVTRPTTVESVNGPAVTTIEGYQIPGGLNGSSAVRCVYLADGAKLIGFTLANGATRQLYNPYSEIDEDGGGAWCQSTNVVISNCVITANACYWFGGGVYKGTLVNCQLLDNTNLNGSPAGGGGAAFSKLLDSVIAGNWALGYGGGVWSCAMSNCTVAANSGDGAYGSTLEDCTLSNNISTDYGGGAQFSTLNHCLLCNNQSGIQGGGAYDCVLNFCVVSNNLTGGVGGGVYYDLHQTNAIGQGNIVVGNVATNFSYPAGGVYLGINTNVTDWTFVSNSAAGDGGGLYLTSPSSTLNHCTFIGNSSGGSGGGFSGPYPNVVTATNCTIISNVAAGSGGGAYSAALDNCFVLGNRAGTGGGVYGTVNACIINSNNATNDGGGLYYYGYNSVINCAFTNNSAFNGGGAYAANSSSPGFSNCVCWANSATNHGGGIDMENGETLAYCIICNNFARTAGGGVYSPGYAGHLSYCTVSDNITSGDGGGVYNSSIVNCLLTGNSAGTNGGGAFYNFYNNPSPAIAESTIANNTATNAGGGVYCTLTPRSGITNCIVYDNSAPANMNYFPANLWFLYCCTFPSPSQDNHDITNNPALVDAGGGDFHLQSNSPCINSGNNACVASAVDLDGDPRIVGGTVDIGAYEYQTPASRISYAWLQQYDLPINTNTDTADPDADGMNNYQEWIAGTNPTNVLSVLEMLIPVPSSNPAGLAVSWQSVSNRTYFLQSSTNLAAQPAFSTIESNIVGQPDTTSYLDTRATNAGPFFYRVGVQ